MSGSVASCNLCSLSHCNKCASLTQCSECNAVDSYYLNALYFCDYCDTSLGYTLTAGKCNSCQVTCKCGGYTLPKKTNGDCSTFCGDGIIISPDELCDDNNLNDDDGCSSKCQVEQYFICQGEPSICYLKDDIQIKLIYT